MLSRLAIGIHNEELRREAFRAFDSLKDVDHLRAFCIAHEAASTAAAGGAQHNVAGTELAGSGLQTPAPTSKPNDVTDDGADDVIASIKGGAQPKQSNGHASRDPCGYCGETYRKGKCPAFNKMR